MTENGDYVKNLEIEMAIINCLKLQVTQLENRTFDK